MSMNEQFIANTIHERRLGIDLLSRPIEPGTLYGKPDLTPEARARAEAGGWQIPS